MVRTFVRHLKRCVTLVETLVGIVLLLAMGALIFPSLMNSLEERAFETAADETNEQLMLARAHAQATGNAVEVMYDARKSQVQARVFSADASESGGASDPQSGMAESWALRALAKGMRIVSRPPPQEQAANRSDSESLYPALGPDDYEQWENFGKGEEIRLAVFMPDGTALMGDRIWLNDSKGRIGVFTINPWSGLPFFQRLADLSAKAIAEQNAQQ